MGCASVGWRKPQKRRTDMKPRLSVVPPTVAAMQREEPKGDTMAFNRDDCLSLAKYGAIAAVQLEEEASKLRKLGEPVKARELEIEAATATLLSNIIKHHIG